MLTDLLQDLIVRGTEFSIEDGKLRVRAPEGVLTPDLLETLRSHKEQLLRLLPDHRFEAPLSAGQEGLWVIQKSAPESSAYNVGVALHFVSETDHGPALRRALQKLVNRHPSLRTTYTETDGSPRQVVQGYRVVDLREIDVAHMSWAEVVSATSSASLHPFDLEVEGGFRACLFRRGPRESVLLLCVHHVAIDGWSFRRLVDELLRLYAADGQANPLPPVKHTYHEFVRLQSDMLASRGEELRRAWMNELEGAPLVLDLPVDRARPPVQTFRGATLLCTLTPSLVSSLRALARAEGTTLYTIFLTAFQILLHSYCGQEDFCVGSTAALRDREELADTLGYMVNILVLRARFSAAEPPDFLSLVGQTRETVLRALDRQDYPFPRLVQDMLNRRDPARPPVIQALFSYQRAQSLSDAGVELFGGGTVAVSGTRIRMVPLPQEVSEVELTLEVTEHTTAVELGIRYNVALFDAVTIERMAGHLTTLLGGIVANPRRPVSQLPLLTAVEREQVLVEWNRTEAPFSREACIHELFEAQVDRSPDAVAVVDLCGQPAGSRGVPISYRELDQRANQVAHRLRRLGVGPDTLVGLCLERSVHLIVGLLGILKAGGAYAVLDPEHPRKRLAFLLEDTRVPVVLTQGSLLARLPELTAQVVDVEQGFEGEPVHRPQSGVGPNNLAYVLYTSGSTGEPNGAMVEHRGLCNVVQVTLPVMDIGPGARLAHVTAFNFDGATGPLFWMLVVGGTIYLAPRDIDSLGKGLIELIDREAITHIFLVPSMLAALPDAELPTLQAISLGGEQVSAELVTRWGRGGRIRNMYGPTEVTIFATAARCFPDGIAPTIGRPIGNIQTYILDSWGQPVPAGVVGELYLGGAGVGRGYLHRPELTARKFIQNPFGEGRLYRTGDMVRYRMTGDGPPVIEFLGRVDGQIKFRGQRIELGEVQNALRAHEDVRDAVVMVQEGATNEAPARIVAYVAPTNPESSKEQDLTVELRRMLGETLPPYMIPSAIVILPALPLNINGKVDMRALPPAPSVDTSAQESEPRSDDEQKLAEVWCKLLGLNRVGIHDSFFEVGGDSLLAVQVISRLPAIFGIELPVRALLEAPTIHRLAQHLEVVRAAGRSAAPHHPLHARPHAGTLPVSLPQRRLWFLSQLEGANVAYNMPFVTQLSGSLDSAALSRSIDEIVRRHESLRTTFRLEAEGPMQVIHPPTPVELHFDDLSGLDPTAREAELEQRIDHEVHRAFDIERGPLLRARLFRVSSDRHVLSLVIHHIVGDGWSMGVFVRELAALYGAFVAARPSPLPEPTLQYADFSRWQEERFAGSEGERQLAYWREKLAHLEPLRLPTDRPRPAVESFRGDHLVFHVDRELTQSLKALSREEGVTLYITLLAAFDVLLARYSGQNDIAVSSAAANRKHPALESLIGFFVNTLVVRCDLSDNPPFRALLSRVQRTVNEATEHEDIPFERVVEELRPERVTGQNPLAQVTLSLQNFASIDLTLPGLAASRWDKIRFLTAKFDLTFLITEVDAGLEVLFEYNSDLFDRRTIERISAHYQNLLRDVVRDRDRPVEQLSLLDADEREQILVEWNRTEAPFSSEACIHELFEAQVDRSPDAVAVVDLCGQPAGSRGVPISYRELDQRANQVAHRLRRLGVGPDTLVGLCLERSVHLLVGLLAILKAGGAYAVLDPEHPRRRLAFLLEDTRVPVVLTQGSLLPNLPETKAHVVDIEQGFEGEPEHRPRSGVGPSNLAYVLYTSGSTGEPNGAMVEHRGLCNVVQVTLPVMDIGPGARLAHVTAFNFDGATGPLFWMLVVGGTVYLAPRDSDSLGKGLIELIDREAITHVFLVPSMLAALPDAELPTLKAISLGGEPVSAELVTRWGHGGRIRNMYGPTEVTIFATAARCFPDGTAPTIGRPIGNIQTYVLDQGGQPVPAGVVGELYLGGAGVGRGYLHRPELTASKFLENPFGPGRLYRTGDMVRYRMTGEGPPVIEFLGRKDNQIKLRGYRIELSEVENALRASPQVKDAVVTIYEGTSSERSPGRLVAYVTPTATEGSKELESEQIASWNEIYDHIGDETPALAGAEANPGATYDPTLDIRGWRSSYTGEELPQAQMRVWAESTIERILDLDPQEVLEVGSGTGMLLARIAPRVRRYRGTDLSRYAIAQLEVLKTHIAGLENVVVSRQPAHDLTGLTGGFDTVILNSVVQYFPSADYLVNVIEGLLGLMGPTGAIFLGDIRNLALLETYHAAVEHHRAGAAIPRHELRGRVQRALINDNELVLHPHFFTTLRARFPQIVDVEITPKRGAFRNELTLFRYDVTLRIGAEPAQQAPIAWRDVNKEGLTLAGLRAWIAQAAPGSTLGLRGLPNARLHEENELRRWVVGDDHNLHAWEPPPADPRFWEPESLFALPAELPCQVRVSWAAGRMDGSLDAIVTTGALPVPRFPLEPPVAPRRWTGLANDPLQGRAHRELATTLRRELREALPSHLVPSAIVVLPALPLNINGKVDIRALPPPVVTVDASSHESEPRSDEERKLADIWSKVLGLSQVGIHDNFFDVGGDSLLAVQVVSRLTSIIGLALPVRALLEAPTIHGLAQHIEGTRALFHRLATLHVKLRDDDGQLGYSAPEGVLTPELVAELSERKDEILTLLRQGRDALLYQTLRARPHTGTLPVSLPQRRLWFLSQLEGANVAYNMPSVTELTGSLDSAALSRSLDEIVRRHESLRTTFRLSPEGPMQVIHPASQVELRVEDLSGLEPAAREAELEQRIDHEVHWAFDIERGPLLRARLFRVSSDRHLLSLVIHHILGDGWSMGVFVRELAALYGAFVAARPSPLPEPTLQYADFSRWQEERLAGSEGERQLAYWREKLAHLEPLRLPTDRPRPAVESFRGDSLVFHVDRGLTQSLKALSREEGVTLYITLLAAFDVLLARYSGQSDIAVSSARANRKHPALEALIGFFVNTVVLRCDLSDNPPFRALLSRVQRTVNEATEHEDIPFERVVEELRPERVTGQNPLAQVTLSLQNFASVDLTLPGLAASRWDKIRFLTAKFDLTFLITEVDAGLEVLFEYNSDLFDRRTIERISAHYQNLLRDVVRDRDRPVEQLSLLDADEREQILVEWNRTEAPFSSEACIHELFEAQVDRSPDAVAVVDLCGQPAGSRGVPISYRELDQRANQVAHRLRRLGVGPDTLVGLCLERSVHLIVGLLGILKAGGAYAVLDPEHPRKRLAFLLEDTRVPVVLTQGSLLARLPELTAQVVDVEQGFEGEPVHRPQSGVGPNNLAYVLYTSGSTGEPNGAMVEHRGLCNVVQVTLPVMDIGPGARLAHVTAFNFDGATGPLFWMLVVGGTIYLAPRDIDSLGKGLIELIDREAITHILLVPAMLAALPDAELPTLRAISLGGEPVSAELVTRWGRGGRIRNMYGPTEVTIFATAARCFPDGIAPTIGRPIGNIQTYILDSWGQPVPAGVVGELYLGGAGVGRGYLHRPELTARKFIQNPFGEGRLYRTGDMVRYRMASEGPPVIEFLGRVDNQIKLNGYRIELGEIQNALRASDGVRDAVVTLQGGTADGAPARIVAYVTPVSRERSKTWELEQITSWDVTYDQVVAPALDTTRSRNAPLPDAPAPSAALPAGDLTLDLRGWKSSYTGEDIPAAEMRVWAESTVARILDAAPHQTLEIGCGTGMLLSRVAPRVERYRATDFSRYAIDHVNRMKTELGGLENVTVSRQPAHDLTGLTGEPFDTVVLNSVVQYFPSADYLVDVIEGLLGLMGPTGTMFLGDIRNMALLETYHASVEHHRAGASVSRRELRGRVQRALINDNELVLHPHFFNALRARFPQIVGVEIAPKRGAFKNELTLFRYDVTLRIGTEPAQQAPIAWRDVKSEGLTLSGLREWIAQSAPGSTLGLRGIPNARLHEENELRRWVSGDDDHHLQPWEPPPADPRAWEPESLFALSAELPCQVRVSWAAGRADGSVDAIVTTEGLPVPSFPLEPPVAPRRWTELASDPLQGRANQELTATLRRELREALPSHLIPSAIVVLPALPLNINGKVDLRALPPPVLSVDTSSHASEPKSDEERQLAEVWCKVLGLERIGIHDNFFEVGGDSLLAVQVVSRLPSVFGLELPVRSLLEAPTVHALAAQVELARAAQRLTADAAPGGGRRDSGRI